VHRRRAPVHARDPGRPVRATNKTRLQLLLLLFHQQVRVPPLLLAHPLEVEVAQARQRLDHRRTVLGVGDHRVPIEGQFRQ
jgi:hypothetical protein